MQVNTPAVNQATAPAAWIANAPSWVARLAAVLPEGRSLPKEAWARRRRVILGLLWLHVGILWVFGALTGHDAVQSGVVSGIVAICAALASWPQRGQRFRSILASSGLLASSIGLVHLSGGFIELHFHFFVMVAVIALYQDWAPFLVAIGAVVLHHGAGSALDPAGVYNHPSAIAHPWLWAAIHGGFILGISSASLVNWRMHEEEYARRVREQERADQAIRQSETHFRSLVQNAADIISVIDADGVIRYMSPAHQRLLGHDAAEVVGSRVFDRVHLDDRVKMEQLLLETLADADGSRSIEVRTRSKDGSWRTLDMIAANWLDDPGIAGIVLNARDITDRKTLEDQLAHQAFHDSLTGLANRALFMDRLAHALIRSNRDAEQLSILYLDFDHFKVVNDSLGHSTGDQLLVAMSRRLSNCTRSGDTVARLGGDEFAILLEDADESGAIELAERITDRFREAFDLDSHPIFGGVSVGIACKESPLDTAGDLVRNADIAMYVAKQRGKGQYVVYNSSMVTKGLERLQLEAELRLALERNEFQVYYQPIVDLSTGQLDEVEALVRWQHPTLGLVMPGEFIPLAEESGLIVPIGLWVMREACRQVRAWQSEGGSCPQLAVSVNLSPRMLQQPALVDDVAQVLAETRLDPSCLRLEITEGTLVQDGPAAAIVMTRLKALGVRLAMDDFGTGYSSLSSLQRFPFDILKIDQSFVRGLGQGSESVAIVQAIIDLATSLNLTVTGEGIETREQMQLLQSLGSHHGQGYLFSRPCSAAEMNRYIGEHATATAQRDAL